MSDQELYRQINNLIHYNELCYCDKVDFKHNKYLYNFDIADIIINYLYEQNYKLLDIIYDHLHYDTLCETLHDIRQDAFKNNNNKLIKSIIISIPDERQIIGETFEEACRYHNKDIMRFLLFNYIKYINIEDELYNCTNIKSIKYIMNYGFIEDNSFIEDNNFIEDNSFIEDNNFIENFKLLI